MGGPPRPPPVAGRPVCRVVACPIVRERWAVCRQLYARRSRSLTPPADQRDQRFLAGASLLAAPCTRARSTITAGSRQYSRLPERALIGLDSWGNATAATAGRWKM